MKIFLSKEKRDKWVEEYIKKHELTPVVSGNFFNLIFTAFILR